MDGMDVWAVAPSSPACLPPTPQGGDEPCVTPGSDPNPPDSERRMEVSYNALSGALTVTPDRDPTQGTAGCFLLFHGVGLTPDGLKDWLRLCAKQVGHDICSPADPRGPHVPHVAHEEIF